MLLSKMPAILAQPRRVKWFRKMRQHRAGSHRLLCMGLFSIFLLSGHGSLRPDLISSCFSATDCLCLAPGPSLRALRKTGFQPVQFSRRVALDGSDMHGDNAVATLLQPQLPRGAVFLDGL